MVPLPLPISAEADTISYKPTWTEYSSGETSDAFLKQVSVCNDLLIYTKECHVHSHKNNKKSKKRKKK